MLAFTLIVALTAHSALAKPTGNCIFMCEAQPGVSGTSGALQQGFGQGAGGFGQGGFGQGGFGQMGNGFSHGGASNFGQGGSGYGQQGMFGNIEDFGTVPVQQPASPVYHRPQYSQPQQTGFVETVHQQVPVQPAIDAMFLHSSGKSSYETNHGYYKMSQPGMTQTVVREPLIMQQPMRQPIRQPNPCLNYMDPCQY